MNSTLLRRDRRGSSLVIVLMFLTVLFSMWAAVCRGTASLIQTQTVMVKRDQRDQAGALNALAQRLWELEEKSSDTGDKTYSAGGKTYAVTMRPDPTAPPDKPRWMIHVSPAE